MTLDELKLRRGRRFWYIFDFGDDHRFSVDVLGTRTGDPTLDAAPRILETHGEPPAQYSDGPA